MKILKLRFKNLNSIIGEWEIDFANPEYSSHGIFALTGPTGAGKTTILDAISLALYGNTPRLKRVNKSVNEIMSLSTGECYASVIFETRQGAYLCHWYQHRAKKSATGALQDCKHEISDLGSGKILESKVSKVVDVVIQKTGMDFERFTRSMLLAQGGFDSFLRADSEDKSRLLEQITGSKIYTEISKQVHDRDRQEREYLSALEKEISGIELLEKDRIKELEQDILSKNDQEKRVSQSNEKTIEAIQWSEQISSLEKDLEKARKSHTEFLNQEKAFAPKKEKLQNGLKAQNLNADYQLLGNLRAQNVDLAKQISTIKASLPELEKKYNEQEKNFTSLQGKLNHHKKELELAVPKFNKIRDCDREIKHQLEVLNNLKTDTKKVSDDIKIESQECLANEKKLQKEKMLLQSILEYLELHKRDEDLSPVLSRAEVLLGQYVGLKKSSEQLLTKSKKFDTQFAQLNKLLEKKNQERTEHLAVIEKIEKQSERVLKEKDLLLEGSQLKDLRKIRDALQNELVLREKVASLEEHRKQLGKEDACPLCGSKEHPFLDHDSIPELSQTQKELQEISLKIEKMESMEDHLGQLQKQANELQKDFGILEKELSDCASELKIEQSNGLKIDEEIKELEGRKLSLINEIQKSLQSYGPPSFTDEKEIKPFLESLQKRIAEWKNKNTERHNCTDTIGRLESSLTSSQKTLSKLNNKLEEHRNKYQAQEEIFERLKQDRIKEFGDLDPDNEEKKCRLSIKNHEKELETQRQNTLHAKESFQLASQNEDSLQKQLNLIQEKLELAEKKFINDLNKNGYENEQRYLESALTSDDIEKLQKELEELNQQIVKNKGRLESLDEQYTKEKSKQLTDLSMEELAEQKSNLNHELAAIREDRARILSTLERNNELKANIKQQETKINEQREICKKWKRLHELIGSADGKKFRNFAQGLTFEIMVNHANAQLKKMSDRYLMLQDPKEPLEIKILDNFQGGEIRSSKNLSGGESFIVSLSLALGLSQMTSRNLKIDTLFIDEGFGTLDEDSLEIALTALSNLQDEGKLIGVISHVPSLKERIPTQINISPLQGGRSEIEGPGCRQIL